MARKTTSERSGATPAIVAVQRAGVDHRVHEYDHEAVDGALGWGVGAADALGVEPARVFKTLVAEAGELVVAVVPVTGELDLRALARHAGVKRARMAGAGDAERLSGSVVGAISPLGLRTRAPVLVDASAAVHETVFVSAGRRGLELELAPSDLCTLADAQLVPLTA